MKFDVLGYYFKKQLIAMKHLRILITAMLIAWFAQVDAQTPISALPTLTAPDSSADWIPIVHSGTTYKVTPGKLFHEFGGGGGSTGWALNGNTVGSEKFIGTLDNYAFPVRVNNSEVWSWETDGSIYRNGNLYSVPYSATYLNTTWGKNAGLGVVAGGGARNIIIGNNAATSLTSGIANVIIGEFGGSWNTGASLTSGIENTIVGSGSAGVLTGGRNTIIGYTVGVGLTSGDHNILVGHRIGRGSGGATSGLTTGTYNIVIGTEETAKYLGTGSTNTIVGTSAAQYLENVSNIDAFGNFAALRSSTATITNSTYLGQGAIAQQSAEVVLGGLKRSKFYFGAGKFTGQNTYLVDIYMQPHSPAVGSGFTDGGDFADKTDGNGVNWYFGVSQPTGTGTAGDMIYQYAPTVQSSGTTQNALATGMTFKGSTGQLQFSTIGALFNPYGTSSGNTGEIRFAELAANGSNYTGFKSPDSRSANLIYTLPSTDPTSGQVLSSGAPSGGVAALSWIDASGSGTVTSIATTSPITGGTITTTGTIGIDNAAADGSTKGAASFTAADFNSSTGLISLDYTNGQAASGSTKGFLTSADWTTFNGKQAAGSYLTADGAVVGALSQLQAFTSGIGTGLIDDNGAGEFLINVTGADRLGVYTTGLQTVSGSAASPSYSFFSDNTSGLYLKTANTEIGASVNGALVGGFNTAGLFANIISEMSAANGVTIDGVNLKDGLVVGQYGGTGVNNSGKTITLGGNLETSGANNVTFTTSGATNVTLPTSGTLVNSAVTTLSSLASIGTVTTGTWNASVLTGQYGGTGVANTGKTLTLSGNTTIGSSTHTVDFATGANTSVTLPASGTLATLAGTETFTNKSIVGTQLTGTAYTFAANNTNATAAYTLQRYEDHDLATYSGTVDFNGTDPSSITSQQYAWSRVGNTVTLFFSIFYGTPGTTNTSATITMPSDCPAPVTFATGGDAASEYIFPISGARVEANMTANPSAVRGGLRRNAANDGYEVLLIFGSVSAAHVSFTLSYRTQ